MSAVINNSKLLKEQNELKKLEASFTDKKPVIEDDSGIKEVWAENMDEEMLKISRLLDTYNNISMDTEFPGFYKKNETGAVQDAYTLIKSNVDILKLIQVGVTLSDDNGNMPSPINTW
jgi:CCR4-NOT transcription complex subunit 7/8